MAAAVELCVGAAERPALAVVECVGLLVTGVGATVVSAATTGALVDVVVSAGWCALATTRAGDPLPQAPRTATAAAKRTATVQRV